MKTFWKNLQLRHKIIILFLPINIISVLIILTISVSLIIRNSNEDVMQNTTDKLHLVANQTDSILSNLKYNIKAFSTDNTLQQTLRSTYPQTTYGKYLFATAIHSSIYNIMDIGSLITDGYIHTADNKLYDIKTDTISQNPTQEARERYTAITQKGGQIQLSPSQNPQNGSAINISKSLIDVQSGKCLGILTFDIKESLFYEAYRTLNSEDDSHFYLTDQNGMILSAQDRSLLNTKIAPQIAAYLNTDLDTQHIIELEHAKNVLLITPLVQENWYMIHTFPYSRLFTEAFHLLWFLTLIGIALICITILLATMLAKSLVRPLTSLTAFAKEVGNGNLEAHIALESNDEIGILAVQFREMVHNIKELTIDIYTEQTHKKEYELNLLQAQINPHFLYNCLDNISGLIEIQENNTAASMIHHLGRYYKAVLSKGRNIITIREELHLVKDYLEIQLIRTPLLFTYSIDIPMELKEYTILKLILQPIVENSVMHGFSGYPVHGHIVIKGWLDSDDIFIEVEDNGRGISSSLLDRIFKPSELMMPKHFGLHNIHERLQLKYGSTYGLDIQSAIDVGTTVTIHFPKIC
ncbi:MAG: histidine kinase [Lachnospiraceae bacterium]